ncbi:hypothetical protein [Tolypothrix sp. VBCCA 56010]
MGSGGQGDKETRRQGDKENSKFNTLPLSPPSFHRNLGKQFKSR